jgi:hypothetical protein
MSNICFVRRSVTEVVAGIRAEAMDVVSTQGVQIRALPYKQRRGMMHEKLVSSINDISF